MKKVKNVSKFWSYFCSCNRSKNNYSKRITHGEAVLSGIILASRLSFLKRFVIIVSFERN